MNTILAFWAAHKDTIETLAVLLLPSIITGLSSKPTPATNALVTILKLILDRLSFLTHKDAAGTLKVPLVQGSKVLPGATVLLILLGLAFPVQAQGILPTSAPQALAPAPVPAVPTPSGCVPSRFGGCVGPWVSFAPVVVVAPVAINLRTKVLEAGFQPGLCYGAQVHNEAWWGFGISACGNLNVGAQTAAFGVMGSFLHGWFQFGWEKGFIGDSNATAPRLLFGLGTAIP